MPRNRWNTSDSDTDTDIEDVSIKSDSDDERPSWTSRRLANKYTKEQSKIKSEAEDSLNYKQGWTRCQYVWKVREYETDFYGRKNQYKIQKYNERVNEIKNKYDEKTKAADEWPEGKYQEKYQERLDAQVKDAYNAVTTGEPMVGPTNYLTYENWIDKKKNYWNKKRDLDIAKTDVAMQKGEIFNDYAERYPQVPTLKFQATQVIRKNWPVYETRQGITSENLDKTVGRCPNKVPFGKQFCFIHKGEKEKRKYEYLEEEMDYNTTTGLAQQKLLRFG